MTVDAAVEAMTEAAFRTGDFSVAEKLVEDAVPPTTPASRRRCSGSGWCGR